MKIDGRTISSNLQSKLKVRVKNLNKKGINPTMAIILVGQNAASDIYVRQKSLKAKEIGANVIVFKTDQNVTNEYIEKTIRKLDKDPNIHGIIIQRPAPKNIDADYLNELISEVKEIDGFGSKSIYPVPVAQAAWKMIEEVFNSQKLKINFLDWLKSKKIVVIGKGITAGRPIINHFKEKKIPVIVVDSKTKNRDKILKSADIIISAVGKTILSSKQIKKGVILIGVGLYSDEDGKLRGDYDDSEVENTASYYSPTPGGVGPVNVSCLLENLIKSAESNL